MKTTLSKIALFLSLSAATFSTLPAAGHTDKAADRTLSVQFTHRTQLTDGDAITAHIDAPADQLAQATLTDLRGHAIWHKDLSLTAGSNTLRFRLADMAPGTYLLNIVSAEGTQTRTFTIR
jgi:hypothetical protein